MDTISVEQNSTTATATPGEQASITGTLDTGAATAATPTGDSYDDAYERARAGLAAQSRASAELAAGATAGASTQAGTDSTLQASDPAQPGAAATETESLVIPASNSGTAHAAPAHWPDNLKGQFDALPKEASSLMMEVYAPMQDAFAQGMEAIRQREAELGGLLGLKEQFAQNPRAVLEQLARDAQVEVFFERPLPEGEVPQFESAADMAKWAADQAAKRLASETSKAEQERQTQLRTEQARVNFRGEVDAAAAKYPDFGAHQAGVMSALSANPGLSVEHAYQLATYAGLRKLAVEGQQAVRELAALKKQQETRGANATRPGAAGTGVANRTPVATDPHDAAYERARARLVSQQTH